MNLVKIHIFWMRCFSLAGWMASSGQLTPATKPPRSVAGVSWFLVGFVPPWLFCRFLVGWSKLECPVHASLFHWKSEAFRWGNVYFWMQLVSDQFVFCLYCVCLLSLE